jgi:hypothetical protein
LLIWVHARRFVLSEAQVQQLTIDITKGMYDYR